MDDDTRDSAAASLAIITRLLIHLTVEGLMTKGTTLALLADSMQELQDRGQLGAQGLVRGMAQAIDDSLPHDPYDDPEP